MRALAIVALLTGSAAGAAAISAGVVPDNDRERLAALTSGLVPGSPTQCVSRPFASQEVDAVGDRLVFRIHSGLVIVAETSGGCQATARDDTVNVLGSMDRRCSGDLVYTGNRNTYPQISGTCRLGKLVTYRRP